MAATIRVMTWNIQASDNPNHSAYRIAEVINNAHADIVALQEVCENRLDQTLERLAQLGWPSGVSPALLGGATPNTWTWTSWTRRGQCGLTSPATANFGNAIVARFPTKNPGQAVLPFWTEARTLFWVEPQNLGVAMRMYTTQISPGSSENLPAPNQVDRVASFFNGQPGARILGGDFNYQPGAVTLAAIRNNNTDAGGGLAGSVTYFPVYSGTGVIPPDTKADYLWFPPNAQVVLSNPGEVIPTSVPTDDFPTPEYTSDHRPLIATFKIG